MKAIRIHETGGPEVLRFEETPEPVPGAGQAVVKVEASGVNFIDTYFRTGLYPAQLPITNGQEGAGTVSAVGPGVTNVRVGDRVAFLQPHSSYAEYAATTAARLVEIPEYVPTKVAAAALLQGGTAHYLVRSTFPVGPTHTALVHACAGGTGLLIVQMAKKFGARVIGTCSTEEKAAKAREAGADEVILYTEQDFEAECRRLTSGEGVDVVYDSVGKTTWVGSLNCLKPRGMMVTFGNASGAVPPFAPLELSKRGSIFVTRPTLNDYVATIEDLQWRAADIFGWISHGELQISIGGEFALSDAATAQTMLTGRKTSGKLLLIP